MAQNLTSPGAIRVARPVLSTIVINTALQLPGVVRMGHINDQWARLMGRNIPEQGVSLLIREKENSVSIDLYIIVEIGSNIVQVGTAVQEEVASAIEEMIGMQVQDVNVYIQDVA